MALQEESVLNGLGIINICSSDINKVQLKTTNCQEHAVIAAMRAEERPNDKSTEQE